MQTNGPRQRRIRVERGWAWGGGLHLFPKTHSKYSCSLLHPTVNSLSGIFSWILCLCLYTGFLFVSAVITVTSTRSLTVNNKVKSLTDNVHHHMCFLQYYQIFKKTSTFCILSLVSSRKYSHTFIELIWNSTRRLHTFKKDLVGLACQHLCVSNMQYTGTLLLLCNCIIWPYLIKVLFFFFCKIHWKQLVIITKV